MAVELKGASSSSANSEDTSTQLQEIMRSLYLISAQMKVALADSDVSVSALTDAFSRMLGYEGEIASAVKQLADAKDDTEIHQNIQKNASLLTLHIQKAVIAFQFYDRLSQRLNHTIETADALGELIAQQQDGHNDDAWQVFHEQIQSLYSMLEEKQLFDEIMQEGDFRQALSRFNKARQIEIEDDIEFF